MQLLDHFLREYERATNSHDFRKVAPLLAEDAIYWFSDGSFVGVEAIGKAFEATWAKIKNEAYRITNVKWISFTGSSAVCVYGFRWAGVVDGRKQAGAGRGTNVVAKFNNEWKMLHEHLSKKP
jgi:ketosteroid isomerase-like protein